MVCAINVVAGIIEQQAFMDNQYMEGVRVPHPLCAGLFQYSQHKERKPERTKHRIL